MDWMFGMVVGIYGMDEVEGIVVCEYLLQCFERYFGKLFYQEI